ncbi:hypothetical protein ACF09J_35810 [Streptomyces sp. NPDC014889]|uniref:hypothetical protein n=1 Tax=Streptomyces sp. NPDC014889 TaxID=3364928 RepID=UPI0036FA009B
MMKITRWALACVGSATLLSGCTEHSTSTTGGYSPGPVATSTIAPDAATQLAARYRDSGGMSDVYGIQQSSGPGGVPLVTVWTRSPDRDEVPFDELKASIMGFMQREKGLSLKQGYLMDVFGPDGRLQHRLDARP